MNTKKRAISESSKEARRQAIIMAGLEHFYQFGFVGAKMEAIAKEVGLSKGTLYLYFNSKETLFLAIIEQLALPKVSMFEQNFAKANSITDLLNGFFAVVPQLLRNSPLPKLFKVLVSDAHQFPDIVVQYRQQVIERMLVNFSTQLTKAHLHGEIDCPEPELTARLIIAPMVLSMLWLVVFEPGDTKTFPVEALLAHHKQLLFKALNLKENSHE